MALPLSVRLTLWHSALFLTSALALLALTYALLRNRADSTEGDAIEFRLNQYVSEYLDHGVEGVQRLAALRAGRAQKAFFVRVGDAENRDLFLRDPADWAEFHPENLHKEPLPEPGQKSWLRIRADSGTELVIAAARLTDGAVVQVGKSNEELRDVLAAYRRSALVVLLLLVPASFAGGAFLASHALRPVKDLTSAAHEIVETSRFDARVPSPGSRDELDALVRVFNEMLGRIDTLVRGMRESIDNVAHDLRTPLTRLRHKAQSAIESSNEFAVGTAACPRCETMVDALADCVEEAERVAMVLSTLMDISEAETGLMKPRAVLLSLKALCERAIDSYKEFAQERGVSVRSRIPANLRIMADETAISRVLANLLDNAIKYTPAGGSVQITAASSDGRVLLRFKDSGIGISAEDLPRIWERLFRGDRSRSERGLGLGLCFVRAIVKAHGGDVSAESRPGEGTTICIEFPAC